MKKLRLFPLLFLSVLLLDFGLISAQDTLTIGAGTSSSSTRGPFQRSDNNSTSVYSRNILLYTAAELSAAGITSGAVINELQWEKGNSNVIIGTGDANLKLYLRNSTATVTDTTDWTAYLPTTTLVLDSNFNTTNNFPATSGWMPFPLNSSFVYTGGAIEIAIDWNSSSVSTPQFDGNGAVTWRWQGTTGNTLVQRVSGSSAPTDINRLKAERANTRFIYSTGGAVCDNPTNLNAIASSAGASLSWSAAMGATSYNWKVVAAGAGSSATAVDSGNVTTTTAMASGLAAITSYDFFVQSDCGANGTSSYVGPFSFLTQPIAIDTVTIGLGTSSSSTRGPFQRADTASSTVFSRFVMTYTAAELSAAGVANGDILTSLSWDLASSNVIIGAGNANMKVYVKNSTATAAVSDTWANLITGSTLVVDRDFNTTNNFPGASGWMPFDFSSAFTYTGGAIEVAVDWDGSQISTPALSGDGSLKWRWETTAPDNLVARKTSSSAPSTSTLDLRDERANIQMFFVDMTVGLGEIENIERLALSPNPTNGIATLNVDLTESALVNVSILNISGQTIANLPQGNVSTLNQSLDLSSFENGIYFVRILVNEQVITKKIVLVK